jgi:chromosome segregation ATPase
MSLTLKQTLFATAAAAATVGTMIFSGARTNASEARQQLTHEPDTVELSTEKTKGVEEARRALEKDLANYKRQLEQLRRERDANNKSLDLNRRNQDAINERINLPGTNQNARNIMRNRLAQLRDQARELIDSNARINQSMQQTQVQITVLNGQLNALPPAPGTFPALPPARGR